MKIQNVLIVRLLWYIRFIYKAKNTYFTRRLNNIVENVQNNRFVINITFKKKNINIL